MLKKDDHMIFKDLDAHHDEKIQFDKKFRKNHNKRCQISNLKIYV